MGTSFPFVSERRGGGRMYKPSLTTVLSVAFLGYMANSMWNIIALYIPPSCPQGSRACLSNLLTPTSSLSLLLFTTTSSRPSAGSDLKFLDRLDVKVDEELERTVNIKFPKSVTKNGSLYLSVFALPALGEVKMSGSGWWQNAISHPHASYSLTALTQYAVPEAETFNLLGDQKEGDVSVKEKEKKAVDRSKA